MRVALLQRFSKDWLDGLNGHGEHSLPGTLGSALAVEGMLAQGLSRCPDIECHVVTFAPDLKAYRQTSFGHASVLHELPARRFTGMAVGWLPRVFAVRRLLFRLQPDIVHGVRTVWGGYATQAVFSGYPHIITIEEFFDGISSPTGRAAAFWIGRRVEALTVKRAQNIVAISRSVLRRIADRTRARIYEIPNVVDNAFFAVGKVASPQRVLFVGRMAPEKGLLDALKASRMLFEAGHRIDWTVVGGAAGKEEEAYLAECKMFADAFLPKGSVSFLGWVANRDIPPLYAHASCAAFLSTARYETFCISVAEAMATGTAPILYDSGPLPEHVVDGESGFVVAPGDLAALAARLKLLTSDGDAAKAMGERARQRAERCRLANVIAQLCEAHQQIAADKYPSSGPMETTGKHAPDSGLSARERV